MDDVSTQQATLEVVRDEAGLLGLAAAWEELHVQAGGRFQDSFAAAQLAWTNVVRPIGGTLAVVVAREAGSVTLIWPLVAVRRWPVTVLEPLGPGGGSDTPLLTTVADAGLGMLLARAWQQVVQAVGADLTDLWFVPVGSALQRQAAGLDQLLSATAASVSVLRLPRDGDWDAYRRTLSRRASGRRDRRLSSQGVAAVQEVSAHTPVAECERTVDWMLEHKRRWRARTGRYGPWLDSPGYRNYLVALLTSGTGLAHVLTLDGTPLAAVLVGTGGTTAAALLTALDDTYAHFSPGAVVLERAVRWAVEHRVDLDLGPGGENFKAALTHPDPVLTLRVAHTARGRWAERARRRLRATARAARSMRMKGAHPAEVTN